MIPRKPDAAWLLVPCIMLTLSAVTLLAPHQAAVAAPPKPAETAAPLQAPADDDDGDELLEHWGDPKYSTEAQHQIAGMVCGFLVLGAVAVRRRSRRSTPYAAAYLPTEADFLKLDSSRTQTHSDTRKAA